MGEEKKFNPSDHLMPLKGKEYLQVMWRLVWFRDEHPDWCIDTKLVSHEGDSAVFVAKVYDTEQRLLASGYGSEQIKDFRDYLEKAETKAIGRALAMLGYGTQFTGDELDEGERIVDSPVEQRKTYIYCADCGRVITDYFKNGKRMTVDRIVARSKEKFGRALCVECASKQ